MPRRTLFCLIVTWTWFCAVAVGQTGPLSGLLIDGQDWEVVAEGFAFSEGPAVDLAGNLYFTDTFRNRIHRINAEGKAEVFVDASGATNGLMFGPDGRLYGCQNGKKRITAWDSSGKETAIAEDVQSNDLVVTRSGGVYFTDPGKHQVWYVAPGGEKRVVDRGLNYPNGLILTPDQGTLVVVDMQREYLYTFRVGPDGSLSLKQPYCTMRTLPGKIECGADGMTVDSEGRIYVATQVGLQVFDTQGRLIGVISKPSSAWLSNVCFAGAQLDTLYVTCTGRVYKRKINAHGTRYFDGPAAAAGGEK
jgi:sugar lactone lactonase YvrE